MNKSKMINIIFNTIMLGGIESSKGDIMSDDPIEDKVYTKRININKNLENINNQLFNYFCIDIFITFASLFIY